MTIIDVLKEAREWMKDSYLVDRSLIATGIQDNQELNDERCWTEQVKADGKDFLSELKVVDVDCLKTPLREKRKDLKKISCGSYNNQAQDIMTSRKTMSWCEEYEDCKTQNREARIVIVNRENRLCVNRFLKVKEMAHLYTRTVDVNARSGGMIATILHQEALDGTQFIENANAELPKDAVGFYLAIEMLLPWCLRNQYELVKDKCINEWPIARAFMIPQFVIHHIREANFRYAPGDDHGMNYLELSRKIHTEYIGE